MFTKIAYYNILGLPVIFYTGVITLLLLLLSAAISTSFKMRLKFLPFPWHRKIGYITVAWAIFHGLLGILTYL